MATREEVDNIVKKIMANDYRKLINVTEEEEKILEELLKNRCLSNTMAKVAGRVMATGYTVPNEPAYEAYSVDRNRIEKNYK